MEFNKYSQYNYALKKELEDEEKAKSLKDRLTRFESIKTLKEAKELAKEILPTSQEVTIFYSGNAKCIVVNKPDSLRISIDTKEEFICYDF